MEKGQGGEQHKAKISKFIFLSSNRKREKRGTFEVFSFTLKRLKVSHSQMNSS